MNANIQTNAAGSGWVKESSGTTWENHKMYYIKTGSGTCAWDSRGNYVANARCANGPEELYYLAASGAIVNEEVSSQLQHLECLTVTNHSGGLIGNIQCPSGTPPASETFSWFPA